MISMYLHLVTEISLLRTEEMWRYFSIQCSPVSDRALIICKFHRLPPFVVLAGATCRRRRFSRFDGMIDTDSGTPKYLNKNLSRWHFFHHKSHTDSNGIEPGLLR